LNRLSEIQYALKDISQEANQITNTSIAKEIPFNSSLDVDQPMGVMKNLSARVLFDLKKTIFINDSIPFETTLKIPVKFLITDSISMNQLLLIDNKFTSIGIFKSEIKVDTNIMIDVPGFRKYKMPIKTTIQLDSTFLHAQLKDIFSVSGKIPISIPIEKEIEYPLKITVPIKNLKVDVDFPIDELVSIHLKRANSH
jgi:hypothetical protein